MCCLYVSLISDNLSVQIHIIGQNAKTVLTVLSTSILILFYKKNSGGIFL